MANEEQNSNQPTTGGSTSGGTDSQREFGAQWQSMISQWERGFDAIATQLMGTEGFARAMNQGQQAGLVLQKTLGETINRHLQALNLPSGDAIRELQATLLRIERRLDQLETRLPGAHAAVATPLEASGSEDTGSQGSHAAPPPRTKQPPSEYGSTAAADPGASKPAGQEAA